MNNLRETDPVGGRDNHLISRVNERHHSIEDGVFAPHGRDHFISSALHAEVFLIALQNRVAKLGHAASRRIAREIGVNCAFGGVPDIGWSVEIRFAGAKVHHTHPLSLEFLGGDHDRLRGGFLKFT
jgi:hypothetical protein